MPYEIHVKAQSTVAEDAAVLTAFNTLITALRAASTHKVDAGGTMIAGKVLQGDEAGGSHQRQGDPW